jgi:hypothetical protein
MLEEGADMQWKEEREVSPLLHVSFALAYKSYSQVDMIFFISRN